MKSYALNIFNDIVGFRAFEAGRTKHMAGITVSGRPPFDSPSSAATGFPSARHDAVLLRGSCWNAPRSARGPRGSRGGSLLRRVRTAGSGRAGAQPELPRRSTAPLRPDRGHGRRFAGAGDLRHPEESRRLCARRPAREGDRTHRRPVRTAKPGGRGRPSALFRGDAAERAIPRAEHATAALQPASAPARRQLRDRPGDIGQPRRAVERSVRWRAADRDVPLPSARHVRLSRRRRLPAPARPSAGAATLPRPRRPGDHVLLRSSTLATPWRRPCART